MPLPRTEGPLNPGQYLLVPPEGAPAWPLVPVLTVPAGYLPFGSRDGVASEDSFPGWVELWHIDSVYTHPCDSSGHPEPVGPSVADLANALAAQPLREGTAPAPVTIGGYDGLYLELSVPDDIDVDACSGGQYNSWPGRWHEQTQVDLLWIVDVEGQRITFDLSYEAKAEELREIVETATFAPTESA